MALRLLCITLLSAGFTFSFCNSEVSASDWPRFRGPNGSGISEDQAPLPVTFGPNENQKWAVDLPGAGVSCPIVVGEKIFVTCYTGYGVDRRDPGDQNDLKRHLVCVNRKDGKTLWTKTVAAELPEDRYSGMGVPEHGYASHTPVSDGKNIYTFLGKSGVYAYDLEGKELWNAKVGTQSDPRRWGSASSPIVVNNLVVVPAGAENRAVIAFDKTSGKEVWKAEANSLGNSWSTPVLSKVDDERTDIVIGAPFEIWGLNPENGRLRWYSESTGSDSMNSSVVLDNGVFYAVEGRSGGSVAVRAGGKGDVSKSHVVWSGRHRGRFSTPVVHEGRLYFISSGIITCLDAKNGDEIYQARLSGSGGSSRGFGGRGSSYASPLLSQEKLYYVDRSGNFFVIKTGDKFEQLAANEIGEPGEEFSATPAISDGDLIVRSNLKLYCFGIKK